MGAQEVAQQNLRGSSNADPNGNDPHHSLRSENFSANTIANGTVLEATATDEHGIGNLGFVDAAAKAELATSQFYCCCWEYRPWQKPSHYWFQSGCDYCSKQGCGLGGHWASGNEVACQPTSVNSGCYNNLR